MDQFKDFHTVKDLKFDIKKLQGALEQVLARKKYDDAAGTKYIASIALKFKPKIRKVTELARAFRCGSIPVIGYISADYYYIDLKAVLPVQINKLIVAITKV